MLSVIFDLLSNGLFRGFIWYLVRDSECPDCGCTLHKVRSRTVRDLHRCRVCERLWVRRDGVYESHVSLKDPREQFGAYLR